MNPHRVGKLLISRNVIDHSPYASDIMEGSYNGHNVVVKRITKSRNHVTRQEYDNMIAIGEHPNIVQYLAFEEDDRFVYIAVEPCICSLHDLMRSKTDPTPKLQSKTDILKNVNLWELNGYPSLQLRKFLMDLVSGLRHLHQHGYIHKNINPRKVLIQSDGNSFYAKLLVISAGKFGAYGFQARELLYEGPQITMAVNLFSIGCLIFFFITKGQHPFGDPATRERNIRYDRKDLNLVASMPVAFYLILRLLDPHPHLRPEAAEVCDDAFFWEFNTPAAIKQGSDVLTHSDLPPVSSNMPSQNSDVITDDQKVYKVSNDKPSLEEQNLEMKRIGKIHYFMHKHIGQGSDGTVVLEGFHNYRRVAVKCMLKWCHQIAKKEIENLINSDSHHNIVRLYDFEENDAFIFIALELCSCSLHDLITDPSFQLRKMEYHEGFILWEPNGYPSAQLLQLMRDIAIGLEHLHELGIIHRDLKPQNVLIQKDNSIRAKIADMAISKQLNPEKTHVSRATGYGTSGWLAPERLRDECQTRAVDLFSMGCLYFFCITKGKHPFGYPWERDTNIINDRNDLSLVAHIPEAHDLISNLINHDPVSRPTACEVPHHPLFWDSYKRVNFLVGAFNRFKSEIGGSIILNALEDLKCDNFKGSWDGMVHDVVRYTPYRKGYDTTSVFELLKLIRNREEHYNDNTCPADIKEVLGSYPWGFDSYFRNRFRNLLIGVYKVSKEHCVGEGWFGDFYKLKTRLT